MAGYVVGVRFADCGSCGKEMFYSWYTCRVPLTALYFAVKAMVDFPCLNFKRNEESTET